MRSHMLSIGTVAIAPHTHTTPPPQTHTPTPPTHTHTWGERGEHERITLTVIRSMATGDGSTEHRRESVQRAAGTHTHTGHFGQIKLSDTQTTDPNPFFVTESHTD